LFEEWFAGFVAAMLRPLRFEHSPLNLVRLALKLFDRIPDFLVCEIGLPNLYEGKGLRLLDDRSGHDGCSLPRRTRKVVRKPVIAPMMKVMMNPIRPVKR
jgi:hypothetical protein